MGWRGPMTHRQFEAWCEWQRQEWHRPSRADHQVAMVVQEIHSLFHKSMPDDYGMVKFKERAKDTDPALLPREMRPLTKDDIARLNRMEQDAAFRRNAERAK